MSECCASGSCEVCTPSAYGYPIQGAEWYRLQATAISARARGAWETERDALDRIIMLERRYGASIFEKVRDV